MNMISMNNKYYLLFKFINECIMKKSSINDITGDSLKSKTSSKSYRDNYDLIFNKKDKEKKEEKKTTSS